MLIYPSIISGTSLLANTKIATVALGALLQLVGVDLRDFFGKQVEVIANAKTLRGWIGAAGGETLDSETITNGDMSSAAGWSVGAAWKIEAGVLTGVGGGSGAYAVPTWSPGVGAGDNCLWKSTLNINAVTTARVQMGISVNYSVSYDTPGLKTLYYTATPYGTSPFVASYFGSFIGEVDNFSVKRVLDLPVTGAKIYSTQAAAIAGTAGLQSWASNDGIDPNYSGGFTYRIMDTKKIARPTRIMGVSTFHN